MTSCLTSMTHRHLRHTSVPRAAAVEIPSPQDRWSPQSRSVYTPPSLRAVVKVDFELENGLLKEEDLLTSFVLR